MIEETRLSNFCTQLKKDKTSFARLLYPQTRKKLITVQGCNKCCCCCNGHVPKTHVFKMKKLNWLLIITSLLKTCSGLNPHMMTFSLQAISGSVVWYRLLYAFVSINTWFVVSSWSNIILSSAKCVFWISDFPCASESSFLCIRFFLQFSYFIPGFLTFQSLSTFCM